MEKQPLSPRLNGYYKDTEGRTLRVTRINPTDTKGRDIVGRVTNSEGVTRDYSTDMKTFPKVWVKEVL